MSTTKIAAEIVNSVRSTGGATVSTTGQAEPIWGYGLALHGLGWSFSAAEFTTAKVAQFIEAHADTLARDLYYVGAWEDSVTGIVWLDVTTVFTDEHHAIEVARSTGEIAVWDFEQAREIRV